jgi:centromere protein I
VDLVNLVTSPGHLDRSTLSSVVRNLYPSEKVPVDVVQTVVGALGEGGNKPSVVIQSGLLRWLIMVYDALEQQKILGRLYGILFNLLDMISLRFVEPGVRYPLTDLFQAISVSFAVTYHQKAACQTL